MQRTRLHTQAAMAIMTICQSQLATLNRAVPLIEEAEGIADALTAAGLKTTAHYSLVHGVSLRAEVPIDLLRNAMNTVHDIAADFGRTAIREETGRIILVQKRHEEINRTIEMTIEEI
ncbi:hypothetical protein [Paludibacterium paludis]|uniref:Uncharacterized protein n=1 Tax=Paludibacterium paludis TaxID=1225769 RepID=A0A918NY41_9NEIS|nr:hypothetical protein [Paludibacterium paludis]GGY03638.1 hypothetical protein GCM10011289_02470 [Paludibacterium paludis]